MSARNPLLAQQPYPVEAAIRTLGANLRIARLRRGVTLQQAAERIGTGPRAVADAEKGKPSTGVAVYVALLWAYGLLHTMGDLANPDEDTEGRALARSREPVRARSRPGELDNDF